MNNYDDDGNDNNNDDDSDNDNNDNNNNSNINQNGTFQLVTLETILATFVSRPVAQK